MLMLFAVIVVGITSSASQPPCQPLPTTLPTYRLQACWSRPNGKPLTLTLKLASTASATATSQLFPANNTLAFYSRCNVYGPEFFTALLVSSEEIFNIPFAAALNSEANAFEYTATARIFIVASYRLVLSLNFDEYHHISEDARVYHRNKLQIIGNWLEINPPPASPLFDSAASFRGHLLLHQRENNVPSCTSSLDTDFRPIVHFFPTNKSAIWLETLRDQVTKHNQITPPANKPIRRILARPYLEFAFENCKLAPQLAELHLPVADIYATEVGSLAALSAFPTPASPSSDFFCDIFRHKTLYFAGDSHTRIIFYELLSNLRTVCGHCGLYCIAVANDAVPFNLKQKNQCKWDQTCIHHDGRMNTTMVYTWYSGCGNHEMVHLGGRALNCSNTAPSLAHLWDGPRDVLLLNWGQHFASSDFLSFRQYEMKMVETRSNLIRYKETHPGERVVWMSNNPPVNRDDKGTEKAKDGRTAARLRAFDCIFLDYVLESGGGGSKREKRGQQQPQPQPQPQRQHLPLEVLYIYDMVSPTSEFSLDSNHHAFASADILTKVLANMIGNY